MLPYRECHSILYFIMLYYTISYYTQYHALKQTLQVWLKTAIKNIVHIERPREVSHERRIRKGLGDSEKKTNIASACHTVTNNRDSSEYDDYDYATYTQHYTIVYYDYEFILLYYIRLYYAIVYYDYDTWYYSILHYIILYYSMHNTAL